MARREERDPYAPPPMHHDRSGAIVRIAIVAALLAGAVWGYTEFSNREQTALAPEVAEEQQMADAGYTAAPSPTPETIAPEANSAPPAPRPARRAAPAPAEPAPAAEPVPPPSTTSTPTTPAPIPPVDVPPAG